MNRFSYAAYGTPSNPVAFFIHGFMGTAQDWSGIVPMLEPSYYCVCVDLPTDCESVSDAVDRLNAMLEQLKILRCAMVGYSMGGRVALQFALTYPEKMNALVLESVSPGIEKEERKARMAQDEQWAHYLETKPWDNFLKKWYEQPVFASLKRNEKLLRKIYDWRSHGDAQALAGMLKRMSVARQASLWSRLGELKIPVLLVAGEDDLKYVEVSHRMRSLVAGSECATIPGSGHIVHLEQPEKFARAVRTFLDQRGNGT